METNSTKQTKTGLKYETTKKKRTWNSIIQKYLNIKPTYVQPVTNTQNKL